ncbi:MAG TPA: hypothetical protein VNW47_04160 [Terriglobales bacterium]|jgi:hypothetical protein|nr:hypothetical protein [Terriglobales bacterium]
MSVAGISSSNFYRQAISNPQNRIQDFQKEFQQLGQDLQAGNLSAAQSDFSSLRQLQGPPVRFSPAQTTNPISASLAQLSKDLQTGNLPAAQQDFTALQLGVQTQASGSLHHHHRVGGGGSQKTSGLEFNQLGDALSAGNLSAAQQAYSVLQTDVPFEASGLIGDPAASPSSAFSVSA